MLSKLDNSVELLLQRFEDRNRILRVYLSGWILFDVNWMKKKKLIKSKLTYFQVADNEG